MLAGSGTRVAAAVLRLLFGAQVEAKRDADKDPPSPKTPRAQNVDADGRGVSAEATTIPPKTPELTRNQSALACFGFSGKVATGEDGDEEVENSKGSKGKDPDTMPSGSVGLKNLGGCRSLILPTLPFGFQYYFRTNAEGVCSIPCLPELLCNTSAANYWLSKV